MLKFHHDQFSDHKALAERKAANRIAVCIPTLNEAATIGAIVTCVRESLMKNAGLVDEILVIDSGSDDDTLEIAAASGARALLSCEIAPEQGSHRGKGENLWKSLSATDADILCYIDGDISEFHPGYVTGLVGPLLDDPEIDYVKAFYQRPYDNGVAMHPHQGGRVSEILIRPLLSLFYPELAGILQPLAGEYAARRSTLEALGFPTGYGVEIAHLIDLLRLGKLHRIGQTDLVRRIHRNRPDEELGAMAFAILRTFIHRLKRDGKIRLRDPLPDLFQTWSFPDSGPAPVSLVIPEPERPPPASLVQVR
jgi:glucosyl-3-phosphoglycerate synthase